MGVGGNIQRCLWHLAGTQSQWNRRDPQSRGAVHPTLGFYVLALEAPCHGNLLRPGQTVTAGHPMRESVWIKGTLRFLRRTVWAGQMEEEGLSNDPEKISHEDRSQVRGVWVQKPQGKGVFQEGASEWSTVGDVPGSLVGHSWKAPTAARLEKSWCWGLWCSCLQAEKPTRGEVWHISKWSGLVPAMLTRWAR